MYRADKLSITIAFGAAISLTTGHRLFRCAGVGTIVVVVAILLNLTLASGVAQAGTVTIVDGPDTDTGTATINDAYVQSRLAAGHFTIDTNGLGSGPDDIQVSDDAMIIWTSEFSLTLRAGNDIVIAGAIQHDGPPSGLGGLGLSADTDENGNGSVHVGTGTQTSGASAGSRHGLTRVDGVDLVLRGGNSGTTPYALLGFRAVDQGEDYAVTGPISVSVSRHLIATGGSVVAFAFAQIGHGGADPVFDLSVDGSFVGPIMTSAGGNVTFQGDSNGAYAQLGHGGWRVGGNHSGNHYLDVGGDVLFQAGGDSGYAQFGNGGRDARGNHSGSHRLTAKDGSVIFQGGSEFYVYAQLGNGGWRASGNHSGDHRLDVGGDVTFRGGDALDAYAQLGNGGVRTLGNHRGDHYLDAGGDITFQGGGGLDAYSQLGNGGHNAQGSHNGDHRLDAGGDITVHGGNDSYAYAQFGNGGKNADGHLSGSLALTATASLSVMVGSGIDAYAMLGNGSNARENPANNGLGSRSGDISVRVGSTALFGDALVGHLTKSDILSVTQGNTVVGVSPNHPASHTPQFIATGVTRFTSASAAYGGELRIYLPLRDSQQIATTTSFNGESFALENSIPDDRIRGAYPFGDGPYAPSYSFYFSPGDTAIAKVEGTVRFASGKGVEGVTVSLIRSPQNLSAATLVMPLTTQTGADGSYHFDSLPLGEYTLSVTLQGESQPVHRQMVVVRTELITKVNPIVVSLGSTAVRGTIYVDSNGNGRYDIGEGADGVTVTLHGSPQDLSKATLVMPLTTLTHPDGSYHFSAVPLGQYTLLVTLHGESQPVHSQTVHVRTEPVTSVDPIVASATQNIYLPAIQK